MFNFEFFIKAIIILWFGHNLFKYAEKKDICKTIMYSALLIFAGLAYF